MDHSISYIRDDMQAQSNGLNEAYRLNLSFAHLLQHFMPHSALVPPMLVRHWSIGAADPQLAFLCVSPNFFTRFV